MSEKPEVMLAGRPAAGADASVSRTIADDEAARERMKARQAQERRGVEDGEDHQRATGLATPPSNELELTLTDGRVVTMGPPPRGVPIHRIVYSALPKDVENMAAIAMIGGMYRALMYVRAVDGRPLRSVANQLEFDQLQVLLGDQGVDDVTLFYTEHWSPAALRDELGTIKKNLR